jgi:hypothetical protein
LRQAGADVVADLNRKVAAGALRNRGGHSVKDALDAGLLREDGRVLYPVCRGIPMLLVDDGIEL